MQIDPFKTASGGREVNLVCENQCGTAGHIRFVVVKH